MRFLAALTIALWCVTITKAATSPTKQSGWLTVVLALLSTLSLAVGTLV